MTDAEDMVPLPPFKQPSRAEVTTAACIVDSHANISAYGSVEWDCLHGDGQVWVAAIVREAMRQPRTIPAAQIADVMDFIVCMAKHFRRRTSSRFFGFRIKHMSRDEAMQHALTTYDASLDTLGLPFGDPSLPWDHDTARALVDEELEHWKP